MPDVSPLSDTTRRVLADIRPEYGTATYRHPLLRKFADGQATSGGITRYSSFWEAGYKRFGDEMEAAVRSLPRTRLKSVEFLMALPDPWMVTGRLSTEMDPNFFQVWNRLRKHDRTKLLVLLDAPLPERMPELVEWVGKTRWDFPPLYFSQNRVGNNSYHPTWTDIVGYNLLTEQSMESDCHTATEADLYELMDSDLAAPFSPTGGTIQGELAELRGQYTPEREALGRVGFRYEETHADFSRGLQQFLKLREGEMADVKTGAVDWAAFSEALEGAEDLSLVGLSQRLAYRLPNAADVHGLELSEGSLLLWSEMLEMSSDASRCFDAVVRNHDIDDVELVTGWMSRHHRDTHLRTFNWLDWVMLAEDEAPHWAGRHGDSEMPLFRQLIEAGVSWEEAGDAFRRLRLSPTEAVEVLVNGTPVEYVTAMRDVDKGPSRK